MSVSHPSPILFIGFLCRHCTFLPALFNLQIQRYELGCCCLYSYVSISFDDNGACAEGSRMAYLYAIQVIQLLFSQLRLNLILPLHLCQYRFCNFFTFDITHILLGFASYIEDQSYRGSSSLSAASRSRRIS